MFHSFLPANFEEKLHEVSPEPMPLPPIVEDNGVLSVIDPVYLDQPSHRDDFVFFRFRRISNTDNRNLAIIIVKTRPAQSIMRNPLFYFKKSKVSEVHTAIRQCAMKLNHHRFVLGSDRADYDRASVL